MIRAGDYERASDSGLMLPRRRGILHARPQYMTGPLFFGVAAPAVYTAWNPSDKGPSHTLSGSDLTCTTGAPSETTRSLVGKSTGKWYWEVTFSSGSGIVIGVTTSAQSTSSGLISGTASYSYGSGGFKWNASTPVSYGGSAYGTGSVIGVMLDMVNGQISFIKGGTNQGVAYSGLSGTFFAAIGGTGSVCAGVANFGASAFSNSVPSGFNAGLY